MIGQTLLFVLALGVGQTPKEFSDADKQAFFKMLAKLPTQPAGHGPPIFTEEALKKAAPSAPVLFALTEKDLKGQEFIPFLILTLQLAEVEGARQFGVKNFDKIAHPRIKIFWANALFQTKVAPPEIVAYLRRALDQEGESLDHLYGPMFQAFKERVILADEIAKEPKVELVKRHVQKNRFPPHGGGHSYHTPNCVFAAGPLLIAARPLNNDKGGSKRDQQGELFTANIVTGKSNHRLIPQPNGFVPKYDFNHYFESPVLSVNSRGDLLCLWTMEGNGHHAFALLKKEADSFAVKRVSAAAGCRWNEVGQGEGGAAGRASSAITRRPCLCRT